jgi:hypothetical protein
VYEDLIKIMCQLYEDLKSTHVEDLLDLSKPAFKFVDTKRFMECINWDKEVLEPVNANIRQYQDKVISVLYLIFPELAEGCFLQRGNVFGSRPFDPNSSKLVTQYDLTVLNQLRC